MGEVSPGSELGVPRAPARGSDANALARVRRPSRVALFVETPSKPGETNRPLCLGRMDGVASAVAGTAIARSHDADVLGRRGSPPRRILSTVLSVRPWVTRGTPIAERQEHSGHAYSGTSGGRHWYWPIRH